jgi:hypothetical protein
VLDLLRDWSAAGLLTEFVWVQESELAVDAALSRTPCSVVSAGRLSRKLLSDHLADARGVQAIRLLVVGVVGAEAAVVEHASAQRLNNALRQGSGEVVPIHCVLARHGAGRWRTDVGWAGWHNAVVAPEEAWHPGAFPEVLYDGGDDDEFLGHCALAAAGSAGLWLGMSEGPFDAQPQPVGGSTVVTRTFVRRLDASGVSSALRDRVLDVSSGLPAPQGASEVESASSPQSAADEMCAALVGKHTSLFRRDRRVPAPAPPQHVGALQALRMLFSFLRVALLGAPRLWAERLVGSVSSGVARKVNEAVFGQDSAFSVVVRGRDSSGRLATIDGLVGGAETMAEHLRSVDLTVDLALPSLDTFWQDFVNGGLTLGDAGRRSPGLEPLVLGGRPVHVRDARAISPAPSQPFVARGRPAQQVASDPVATHDVLGIQAVREALSQMIAQDGAAAVEAGAELGRLNSWSSPLRSSYAGRVGGRLCAEMRTAREDVGRLRDELAQAGGSDSVPVDVMATQERLARIQRILAVSLLLVLAVAAVAASQGWVRTSTAVGVGVGAVLSGTVASLLVFLKAQKILFQFLHRRRQQIEAVETARYNLVAAVRELHRASVLYRQYLQWAPVLGRFLEQPFGTVAHLQSEGIRLQGRLPRALWLGHAVPDDDAVGHVAHDIGRHVFAVGWLGAQWDRLLLGAPARLGPAGHQLRTDPQRLFGDPAEGADSPLVSWRGQLEAHGTGDDLAEVVWTRATDALERLGATHVNRTLLHRVEVLGGRHNEAVTGVDVLEDLALAVTSPAQQAFDLALFTPRAQGAGAQGVVQSMVASSGGSARHTAAAFPVSGSVHRLAATEPDEALDQFVALVQVSAGVPADDLMLAGGGPAERTRPDNELATTTIEL